MRILFNFYFKTKDLSASEKHEGLPSDGERFNITVTDQEDDSAPAASYQHLLPVIISVLIIITLAVVSPVLIYISKKNANKRNTQKLTDIRDDILRHEENLEVKREIENSFEAQLEIPGRVERVNIL